MINKNGFFNISPKLTDYDRYYLHNFHATPHLKRKVDKLIQYFSGSQGYNGEYDKDGELFIKNITDHNGKIITDHKNVYNLKEFDTIVDFKNPPPSQPSVDCPWKPNNDGTKIITSGGIEYYQHDYGWIKWLVKNIFKDKYTLNGEYTSRKNNDDKIITIRNNKISIRIKNGISISTNKSLSISKNNGQITINPKPKKKHEHEIVIDITNRTKNGNIKWTKENTISPSSKYLSFVDFGNGVKVLLSLFTREFNTNKNYINIHIKKGEKLFFYKTISSYFVIDLIRIVEKETK